MSKDQPDFSPPGWLWSCRERLLALSPNGMLMGILNITPDSFSDGGRYTSLEQALRQAREMIRHGAQIIDVGGESSRPGASIIPEEEERRRILPVLENLAAREPDVALSVDTTKASVAQAALEAGAHIINDVSGLRGDPQMAALVAERGAGLVLMHRKGTPETMQVDPHYDDVTAEVAQFFRQQIEVARQAGVSLDQIVLDPGIGFGKTLDHNLTLLRNLDRLAIEDRQLLLGVSRKSLFHNLLDLPVEQRALPTAIVTALTTGGQVAIHRVHDVAVNHQALELAAALGKPADRPGQESRTQDLR
jgi:dihydropteroate synthase